jgi:ribose transport system permease protein
MSAGAPAPTAARSRLAALTSSRWGTRVLGPGGNRSIGLAYLLALVMFLVITAYTPGFASPNHVRVLLIEASFIGLVGLGQTFVILGGGVDLSIPWTLNAVAILVTVFANGHDSSLFWAIPLVLCLAALVGLVNGIGVAVFEVSPIIMTLGMNVIVEGALLIYMGSNQPQNSPTFMTNLAIHRLGPIPYDTLLWLAVTALATVVLTWTTFGRRLYAVGTSRTVSVFSGVNVSPVVIFTYVISAVCAGIAGIIMAGYYNQAYLGMGDPYLFASVAAVAIGGAPITGGSGHYLGTVAGALILTLLAGLLPLLNLAPGWLNVIYGLAILLTVGLATLRFAGDDA